jgi:SAM-dependent methyltransferase
MSVFNEYARYYDLLYRDKDYACEAEYVHKLIQTHAPGARSILNLGCGSGRHDRELEKRGYRITGVDLSEEMLTAARRAAEGSQQLAYHHGDIRTVRLDEKFDVVISLFHVMSYQTTDDDLLAALRTANEHLNPDGLFVFDCWYGPGVLTDRPAVRVKELEDDALQITRIAQPVMYPNDNAVDVNFHVFIRNKDGGQVHEIRETHRMRYLFAPEIRGYSEESGFNVVKLLGEFSTVEPDDSSWAATICLRVRR